MSTQTSRVPCDRNTILVVDDEEDIRELVQSVLQYHLQGRTVRLAADGVEAVEAFTQAHPAVIVMDLRMGRMDGRKAFLAIMDLCTQQGWEEPAVVFYTGYTPPNTVQDLAAASPRHCLLQKPSPNNVLVKAVEERLEWREGELRNPPVSAD